MPTQTRLTSKNSNKRPNEAIEAVDSNGRKKKVNNKGNAVDQEFSEEDSDSGSESENEHDKFKQVTEVDSRHREYVASGGDDQDAVYEHEVAQDDDELGGDGDDQRWNLSLDDLKPRPKEMPKKPSQVYDQNLRLINLDDRARVRKIARELIFPKQKFISPEDRTEEYDRPKKIVRGTLQYKLMKNLSWTGPNTNQVELAIRWNTYSKEVEKTLKQQQSTSISQIKKMFLDGKFLFISA